MQVDNYRYLPNIFMDDDPADSKRIFKSVYDTHMRIRSNNDDKDYVGAHWNIITIPNYELLRDY